MTFRHYVSFKQLKVLKFDINTQQLETKGDVIISNEGNQLWPSTLSRKEIKN